MTMEQIKKRARRLHDKTRGELLRITAAAVFAAVLSGWGIAWDQDVWPRSIFAVTILWILAGQYFIHRRMWTVPLPGDSALSTGLEYYRQEIQLRGRQLGQAMQWLFGPIAFGLCGLILALLRIGDRPLQRNLVNMIPFLVLSVLWIVGIFVFRFRAQRDLQQEIKELNRVEE